MPEFTRAEFTGERVIPELVDTDLFNEHLARYRFAKRFLPRAQTTDLGARQSGNSEISAAAGESVTREFFKSPYGTVHILDAGCGSGYGTAELASTCGSIGGFTAGTDVSAEAIEHARSRYAASGAQFLPAACEALPFRDATFDLVVAFEVIEHLDRRQQMLAEASRVLKPSGVFLVSTPNRDAYAESRGDSGPNPFHRHEFDSEEFRRALGAVFPHVRIWTQNHAEAIVFSPTGPESRPAAATEASGENDPASAQFYVAACSHSPIAPNEAFAWIPSSANVLMERERHIAKLNGEVAKKDAWLRESLDAHRGLQASHNALIAELEDRNRWAAELDRDIAVHNTRIVALQDELEDRNRWAAELDRDIAARNMRIAALQDELAIRLGWVRDLESQIEKARGDIARLEVENAALRQAAKTRIDELEATVIERSLWAQSMQAENARLIAENAALRQAAKTRIDELEATVVERSLWAQSLDAEIEGYRAELRRIGASPWVRAGEKLGIGPRVHGGPRVRDGQ